MTTLEDTQPMKALSERDEVTTYVTKSGALYSVFKDSNKMLATNPLVDGQRFSFLGGKGETYTETPEKGQRLVIFMGSDEDANGIITSDIAYIAKTEL